jgi:hypothetical protein
MVGSTAQSKSSTPSSRADVSALARPIVALAERLDTDLAVTLDHRHFAAIEPAHRAAFRLAPGRQGRAPHLPRPPICRVYGRKTARRGPATKPASSSRGSTSVSAIG